MSTQAERRANGLDVMSTLTGAPVSENSGAAMEAGTGTSARSPSTMCSAICGPARNYRAVIAA